MRKIELRQITIDDENYPIYCDMFVLQKIQEEYKSINQFERDLMGYVIQRDATGEIKRTEDGKIMLAQGEPVPAAVLLGARLMIDEGMTIEEEQTGIERERLPEKHLGRIIDIPFEDLAKILHEEFSRCFVKKNPLQKQKNRKKNTQS